MLVCSSQAAEQSLQLYIRLTVNAVKLHGTGFLLYTCHPGVDLHRRPATTNIAAFPIVFRGGPASRSCSWRPCMRLQLIASTRHKSTMNGSKAEKMMLSTIFYKQVATPSKAAHQCGTGMHTQ